MFSRYPTVAAVQEGDPFEVAAALAPLSAEQIDALLPEQAEVVVAATQRVINAMTARQQRAISAFHEATVTRLDAEAQAEQARLEAMAAEAAESGREVRRPRLVPRPDPTSVVASMLAPILRVAPRTMGVRVRSALTATSDLPRTHSMALAGDLEPHRMQRVVDATAGVDPARMVEFEARLHDVDITDLSTAQVGQRAATAAVKADPESVERRAEQARRRRRVEVRPADATGMASWRVEIGSEISRRMWAAVEALAKEYVAADRAARRARPDGGVTVRTLDNARVDALADLVLSNARVETTVELRLPASYGAAPRTGPPDDSPPPTAGSPPGDGSSGEHHVGPTPDLPDDDFVIDLDRVVVKGRFGACDPVTSDLISGRVTAATAECTPVEWALALELQGDYHVETNPSLSQPWPGADAFVVPSTVVDARHGLLLPDAIQTLLADPDLRLRLTTPTPPQASPSAERTYRPGAAVARHVRRRDVTCRFPGCATPAAACDLDHVVAWPFGPTAPWNLICLCRAHHGFKHHAGWRLTLGPDGAAVWTAPTGRQHTTYPPDPHDQAC